MIIHNTHVLTRYNVLVKIKFNIQGVPRNMTVARRL